jgi:hypothetical protein
LADLRFQQMLFVLCELDDHAFPWHMISLQRQYARETHSFKKLF